MTLTRRERGKEREDILQTRVTDNDGVYSLHYSKELLQLGNKTRRENELRRMTEGREKENRHIPKREGKQGRGGSDKSDWYHSVRILVVRRREGKQSGGVREEVRMY